MPINCTLTYSHKTGSNDGVDVGVDADEIGLMGPVKFIPELKDNRPALATGESPPTAYTIPTFTGFMEGGVLKNRKGGTEGVRVWSNDPSLNIDHLFYRMVYDLYTPKGTPVPVDAGVFEVPATDSEVKVAQVLQPTGTSVKATGRQLGLYLADIVGSGKTGRDLFTADDAGEALQALGIENIQDEAQWLARNPGAGAFPAARVTYFDKEDTTSPPAVFDTGQAISFNNSGNANNDPVIRNGALTFKTTGGTSRNLYCVVDAGEGHTLRRWGVKFRLNGPSATTHNAGIAFSMMNKSGILVGSDFRMGVHQECYEGGNRITKVDNSIGSPPPTFIDLITPIPKNTTPLSTDGKTEHTIQGWIDDDTGTYVVIMPNGQRLETALDDDIADWSTRYGFFQMKLTDKSTDAMPEVVEVWFDTDEQHPPGNSAAPASALAELIKSVGVNGLSVVTTAGSTTTLTSTSKRTQAFSGTPGQTVKLPAGILGGDAFEIVNFATGSVDVQADNGDAVLTVPFGYRAVFDPLTDAPSNGLAWLVKSFGPWGTKLLLSTENAATVKNKILDDTNQIGGAAAAAVHNATVKATPVDNDEFLIADSAASYGPKRTTWSTLKTLFATYYNSLAATLTNKTLSGAKVDYVNDTNNAGMLLLNAVASAVNYLQLFNAIAGAGPTIAANGTDTNVDLNLVGKGTGKVKANGGAIVTRDHLWTPADSGLIGWAFDPAMCYGSVEATAGFLLVTAIKVPAGPITNILINVDTQGASLTNGQCKAALFQNGALLGETASQHTAWQTTGVKEMAISGGPVTVQAGLLYVGLWANGTTPPRLSAAIAQAGANVGVSVYNRGSNKRFGYANTGLTSTAPSTLAAINDYYPVWMGVS